MKLRQLAGALCFSALMGLGAVVQAAEAVPAAVSTKILAKLQAARPDFMYGEIKPTAMDNIYQVQVENGPLLYVSADGGFIITGTLYGVTAKGFVDLKEQSLKPERVAKLNAVPESDKVVFPAEGKTKAYIHVFTDVDCGYCRKLHREVPAMNAKGIEVRYLAYPRAGIGSASHKKIAAAWCAKDDERLETMTKLKNGQGVNVDYCQDNPVADHFRLGGELGVRGTPAIVLADGTMLPGYLTADQLAMQLGL
ncbi:DsbC family protein [Pseudomaricurvus alkylphenolicus]|uniref:DsbC family protein n=1 Tax=Pseudomaricurvus alkylphenolicus TaxID=1306991 RepID=UPI001F0E736B|nr:DsbC family protein [Pseudomaricurvus alkylphenolicus]